MLPTELLDILVCPVCNGGLVADEVAQRLCCLHCRLAYPVREGIPVMLVDQAEKIADQGSEDRAR
jgi:uncharacterized protein YbaR (Trm112 family)